jgi:hypothetical protein
VTARHAAPLVLAAAAARSARRWVPSVFVAGTLAAAGCSRPADAPAIAWGTPCAACGMSIEDRRFACEREAGRRWRAYDSIECLLRDGAGAGGLAYLADHDRSTLHAADSLWVVKGEFLSPMGGGYAAFLERGAAEEIAARTRGRVGRLAEFMRTSPEPAP